MIKLTTDTLSANGYFTVFVGSWPDEAVCRLFVKADSHGNTWAFIWPSVKGVKWPRHQVFFKPDYFPLVAEES